MAADANNNEIWKDIPGWEGAYQVSNQGRVRNRKGLVLKPRVQWTGYDCAVLWRSNVPSRYYVHRLVCAAFIGPRPDNHDVNHIDGVRLNNFVGNLEYVTRSQNQMHRRITGTAGFGEKNGNSKLTASDVLEIRRLRAAGVSRIDVAKTYGVTVFLISKITSRELWHHI